MVRYGLVAVFVGAGIEGEAVMLTAGYLAHKGLMPILGVAIAGALGACTADQLWFWIARHYGHVRWIERAKRKPAFKRALSVLEHHLILFTLGFRFIYGMRTVTPIAISASKIRSRTFVLLNIISAAIWGPIMAGLGYGFGRVIDPWLHGFQVIALVAVIIVGAIAIVATRSWRARRRQPV